MVLIFLYVVVQIMAGAGKTTQVALEKLLVLVPVKFVQVVAVAVAVVVQAVQAVAAQVVVALGGVMAVIFNRLIITAVIRI
jgi:hypothetical protein